MESLDRCWPGTRIVAEKEVDPERMGDTPGDEATTELKKNAWDDYLATMQQMARDVHGRMVYKSPDDMCFDVYAARQETVCPVWTTAN